VAFSIQGAVCCQFQTGVCNQYPMADFDRDGDKTSGSIRKNGLNS